MQLEVIEPLQGKEDKDCCPHRGSMSQGGVLGKNKVYLWNGMSSGLLEGRNTLGIRGDRIGMKESHMVGGFECYAKEFRLYMVRSDIHL